MRHTIAAVVLMAAGVTPVAAQGFHPPCGYGFGFPHPVPFGPPLVYPWGWYPPVVVVPVPVVVVPRPAFGFGDPGGIDLADLREPNHRREDPAAVAARVDGAVKRGDFVVVEPKGNGIKWAGAEKPVPPEVKPPKPVPPPVDPLIRAQQAFEAGELGRATERLTAFIAAEPDVPLGYFLLAQVRTARGEYAEAVAAIQLGMKKAPDWPRVRFPLVDFYGAKPERLKTDLTDLMKAVEANPDDPTLLFLDGYHRWFAGDQPAAVVRFTKARGLVRDPAVIDLFLKVK